MRLLPEGIMSGRITRTIQTQGAAIRISDSGPADLALVFLHYKETSK